MVEQLVIETPDGTCVARLRVSESRGEVVLFGRSVGTQYIGEFTERDFPSGLQQALDEYRELIDDQILGLVDAALQQILQFGMVVRTLPEGELRQLADFQLLGRGESALVAIK